MTGEQDRAAQLRARLTELLTELPATQPVNPSQPADSAGAAGRLRVRFPVADPGREPAGDVPVPGALPGTPQFVAPVDETCRDLLGLLHDVGTAARRALEDLDARAAERDAAEQAERRARDEAARRAFWATWEPPAHPPGAAVIVTYQDGLRGRVPNEEDTARSARGEDRGRTVWIGSRRVIDPVVTFDVTDADGTRVATVTVEPDGQVGVGRRFERAFTSWPAEPALPRPVIDELQAASPWKLPTGETSGDIPTDSTGAGAEMAALLGALLQRAPAAGEWVRRVLAERRSAADAAAAQQAEYERVAAQWRATSRRKDRIPAAALTKWLLERSSIEYRSDGSRAGGWEVVAVPVSGGSRPSILDPDRGGWSVGRRRGSKPIGAARVLFVARLEHRSVFRRDRSAHHRFYDSDVTALQAALPGCVVKAPEDMSVLFVAFDSPEHVAVLDGALAEWILLGGTAAD